MRADTWAQQQCNERRGGHKIRCTSAWVALGRRGRICTAHADAHDTFCHQQHKSPSQQPTSELKQRVPRILQPRSVPHPPAAHKHISRRTQQDHNTKEGTNHMPGPHPRQVLTTITQPPTSCGDSRSSRQNLFLMFLRSRAGKSCAMSVKSVPNARSAR